MSTTPALPDLDLPGDVLRENDPDPLRVVLWLPGDERPRCRHWRRVSGHLLGGVALPDGVRVTPVRVSPFREDFRGDVRRLFDRFWAGRGQSAARFILPTGEWVEPDGEPRDDALLAWADEPGATLDAGRAAERWPGNEACLALAPNLLLVLGVTPPAPPPRLVFDPAPAPKQPERRPQRTVGLPDAEFHQDFRSRRRRVKELFRQGQYDEAAAAADGLLAWARERWFDGHPAVGTCLLVLAVVQHGHGDDALAERLYREVLDIYCPDLGDNHPNFATGLNNLALLYQARGNYLDAEPLFRQALELRLGCMGEAHALTATSLHNLALVLHGRGDSIAAEALLLRALDVFRRTLGEAHPDVARCLDNLAALYQAIGDDGTAAVLAGQARQARADAEGKELVLVIDTLNLLGELPPVRLESPAVPAAEDQAAALPDLAGVEGDPFPWLVPAATANLTNDIPAPAGLATPPPEEPADWTKEAGEPIPSEEEFHTAETCAPLPAEPAPVPEDDCPLLGLSELVAQEAAADPGCAVWEFTAAEEAVAAPAEPAELDRIPEPMSSDPSDASEAATDSPLPEGPAVVSAETAAVASSPAAAPVASEEFAQAAAGTASLSNSPEVWDDGSFFEALEDLEEADRALKGAIQNLPCADSGTSTGLPAAEPPPADPPGAPAAFSEEAASLPEAPSPDAALPSELESDEPTPIHAPAGLATGMQYPVALPASPVEAAAIAGDVPAPLEEAQEPPPAAAPPEDAAAGAGPPEHDGPVTVAVAQFPPPEPTIAVHVYSTATDEVSPTEEAQTSGDAAMAHDPWGAPLDDPDAAKDPALAVEETGGPLPEPVTLPQADPFPSAPLAPADWILPGLVCATDWQPALVLAKPGNAPPGDVFEDGLCGDASVGSKSPGEPAGEQPPAVQDPTEDSTQPGADQCLTQLGAGRVAEAITALGRALARGGSSVLADLPPPEEKAPLPADLALYLSLIRQHPAAVPGAAAAAYDFLLRRRAAPQEGVENARADIARRLPPDGALIEFVRFRPLDLAAVADGKDPGWLPARDLAFALRAGETNDVSLVDLGEAAAIDRLVADCRARLADRLHAERPGPAWRSPVPRSRGPEPTVALRQAVFDPVAAAVGGRTRLTLAPAGSLACLPFEVLTHADGRPLLETHRLSYVGSGLDVLRFATEPAGEPGPAVVAVDPDFDLFLAPGCRPYSGPDSPPGRFARLSGTRRPGKQFASLLGVEPWVAGAVRKERLLAVRSPHVLHLGTHCVLTEDGASLALAGANGPGAEAGDGLLAAAEVGQLDLEATELVVLPACDAAGGEAPRGESLLSLCRAFQEAGAAAVVVSHWKVTDWHAKELLADFYQRVLAGEPRAEALRQAQLALKARYPDHLEYWGAFVCHGDPGPVQPATAPAAR
jgi:tetratricopeptide (TPR) repeat protein